MSCVQTLREIKFRRACFLYAFTKVKNFENVYTLAGREAKWKNDNVKNDRPKLVVLNVFFFSFLLAIQYESVQPCGGILSFVNNKSNNNNFCSPREPRHYYSSADYFVLLKTIKPEIKVAPAAFAITVTTIIIMTLNT